MSVLTTAAGLTIAATVGAAAWWALDAPRRHARRNPPPAWSRPDLCPDKIPGHHRPLGGVQGGWATATEPGACGAARPANRPGLGRASAPKP